MQYHETQVIIADDQFLIIEALQKLLLDEFHIMVISAVSCKQELVKTLVDYPGSLVIMDHNHIDFENIAEIGNLIIKKHDAGVLILVNSLQKNELAELSAMGIKNILLKTADRDEVITGIKSALSGKKYYCQEVLGLITDVHQEKQTAKEHTNLTLSEIEIVKAIAEGYTTKQIAAKKFVSYHTVMTHRKNIFRKLRINNASELVMLAIRKGIIDIIDYQI